MAGLQRSAISFRRQGSSGLIWDDKLLTAELTNQKEEEEEKGEKSQQDQNQTQKEESAPAPTPEQGRPPRHINTIERSRSNGGGRAFRTGRVSPAIEPPSPRVSACGFCNSFGNKDKIRRRGKPVNRKM